MERKYTLLLSFAPMRCNFRKLFFFFTLGIRAVLRAVPPPFCICLQAGPAALSATGLKASVLLGGGWRWGLVCPWQPLGFQHFLWISPCYVSQPQELQDYFSTPVADSCRASEREVGPGSVDTMMRKSRKQLCIPCGLELEGVHSINRYSLRV